MIKRHEVRKAVVGIAAAAVIGSMLLIPGAGAKAKSAELDGWAKAALSGEEGLGIRVADDGWVVVARYGSTVQRKSVPLDAWAVATGIEESPGTKAVALDAWAAAAYAPEQAPPPPASASRGVDEEVVVGAAVLGAMAICGGVILFLQRRRPRTRVA